MFSNPYFDALLAIALIAIAAWGLSVIKKDVSFVDSLWSLFFLVVAILFAFATMATDVELSARALIVVALVTIWALRLSIYITARNWGKPEDYRYQSIRANNEPLFVLKSLYIVFGLQGLLAWVIAVPLLPAITAQVPLNALDIVAAVVWLIGFIFEAGGDYQLAKFKQQDGNAGKVLDTGLWRYTRHPNYFGDFCIWWGFYLFALAAGGWWTIYAPLLMTVLLFKVSGVAMLEKTIGKRRPEYANYIQQTRAFFPGPRRPAKATS